jgi:hypothetical protein
MNLVERVLAGEVSHVLTDVRFLVLASFATWSWFLWGGGAVEPGQSSAGTIRKQSLALGLIMRDVKQRKEALRNIDSRKTNEPPFPASSKANRLLPPRSAICILTFYNLEPSFTQR